MTTVAFLGLGAMGTRMASNLLGAGYELRVWNRSTARCTPLIEEGAMVCESPQQAVSAADVTLSMLKDDAASREVWLDGRFPALQAVRADSIVVECSTLSISWIEQLAEAISQQGADLLDAPVVGSRPQAEARQLIQLVGGRQEALGRVREILSTNATSIYHLGPTGAGSRMKLAVNGLFSMQVAGLSEILGLLKASGHSPEASVGLFNDLPTTSPALKGIGALIASENYQPMFPIDLVEKDLGYLEQLGNRYSAKLPMTHTTRAAFQEAQRSGYGDENIAAVAKLSL